MLNKDLTKTELIEILEIIEGTRFCVDKSDLKRLLLKSCELAEADNSVCGIVEVSSLGPTGLKDALNGNYPEKMFEHYLDSKLFLKDPIVRYHANFSIARSWSEIFREVNDEQARQVVNYASDFGLKHGISSALFLPEEQGVFIVSYAGHDKKSWVHQKKIADILTTHLGNAMLRCSFSVPVASGADVAGVMTC